MEETTGEATLVETLGAKEGINAPPLATTIGSALSVKTPILHSARYAIAVRRLVQVAGAILVVTEGVQTVVHNVIAGGLTDVITTIVKRFTTTMIGPALSAETPILRSVRFAIVAKLHALVVQEAVPVLAETVDATAVAVMVAAVDTVEVAETVTDATAVAVMVAAVDTVEVAETVTDAAAVAVMVVAVDTVVVTAATAVAVMVVAVDTVVVAAVIAAADTVVETVTDAAAVTAAADTAVETETDEILVTTDEIMVATDEILAAVVKIIAKGEAMIPTIVRLRANALGTPTTENRTTFNQGSTTDTTIDER